MASVMFAIFNGFLPIFASGYVLLFLIFLAGYAYQAFRPDIQAGHPSPAGKSGSESRRIKVS